jgi:transcriptional regulator with XRE-family HTH domain
MVNPMKKLVDALNEQGLTQLWLAEKIGTHETHLNKILKGKASMTKRMAARIASLSEIDITEEDLMYPKLSLNVIGQYFTDYPVKIYQIERPQVNLSIPILPTWFGVFDRGNKNKTSVFHSRPNKSMLEIYDSQFQRDEAIDERAIGNFALICTEKDELISCKLGTFDKSCGQYQFWSHYSSNTRYAKIKWCSILLSTINMKALSEEFDWDID